MNRWIQFLESEQSIVILSSKHPSSLRAWRLLSTLRGIRMKGTAAPAAVLHLIIIEQLNPLCNVARQGFENRAFCTKSLVIFDSKRSRQVNLNFRGSCQPKALSHTRYLVMKGQKNRQRREILVPKGRRRIAQCFSAGWAAHFVISPEGTKEARRPCPFGHKGNIFSRSHR